MLTPRPRFRFYGSPKTYLLTARHVLRGGRVDRGARELVEQRVAEMIGVSHAVCVPQARFGLYLALKKVLSPTRLEVVLSPYTIHDVVNMVICAGGRPVFADVDPLTCNIDPAAVESLISHNTGAVLITHLHGLACEVERLQGMCETAGVPLIEDAAQAFGAQVSGRQLGSFGKASVFSFGRAKNINAFYGGMVVTDDARLAEEIRLELTQMPEEDGMRLAKRIAHCAVGDVMTAPVVFPSLTFRLFRYAAMKGSERINKVVQTENDPVFREQVPSSYERQMTDLQACLVAEQLPQVAEHNRARIRLADIYHAGLSGQPGLTLPPHRNDGSHIYLQYPVQLDHRWDYVRYMMKHGRDVAIQHMSSAAELPIFSSYARDCPQARAIADRLVLLPTYPGYGAEEAEATVRATQEYLRQKGNE